MELNGSLTGFLYDDGKLIAEYDDAGFVVSQYIHGLGLGHDVGSLICKETSESTAYYFYNYRGDVIDIVDDAGAIQNSYRYTAFGNLIDGTSPDLGFSSKRYDSSTALSYFGARYYDSTTGRFISRDPLGYIDGPNGYIYVSNNPILLIDPFGLTARTAQGNFIHLNNTLNIPMSVLDDVTRYEEEQAFNESIKNIVKTPIEFGKNVVKSGIKSYASLPSGTRNVVKSSLAGGTADALKWSAITVTVSAVGSGGTLSLPAYLAGAAGGFLKGSIQGAIGAAVANKVHATTNSLGAITAINGLSSLPVNGVKNAVQGFSSGKVGAKLIGYIDVGKTAATIGNSLSVTPVDAAIDVSTSFIDYQIYKRLDKMEKDLIEWADQ